MIGQCTLYLKSLERSSMSYITPYYILLSSISTERYKEDRAQVCLRVKAETPNDMVNPSVRTNGKSSFANMHHSGVINLSAEELCTLRDSGFSYLSLSPDFIISCPK